jgi:hypothetical protein
MKLSPVAFIFFCAVIAGNSVFAQDSAQSCKVELKDLAGKYTGECKNGYANGKGEATGLHHYIGVFKNGLPNGTGIYYYSDSNYYSGSFQEGIKEGKGEFHYIRKGVPDSLIKGYWSADEFRGKNYVTNKISGTQYFDNVDITPTKDIGHTMKIEISTTSGTPNGGNINNGFVLTLANLTPTNGVFASKVSDFTSGNKSSVTYDISKFPAYFFVTLSNGQTFNLELYKAANWTVRLYKNQ